MATVSFANDIMPILYQYRGPMMWRFDLTKYGDVKANANLIYSMIQPDGGMPPPPFPPLSPTQVALFQQWIAQNFPP